MRGKGYHIGEKAGLIDHKHVKAMGQARWLFSWAIRRQTGTTKDGWGVVLYGNVITYKTIWADLREPERTLQRSLTRLVKCGYLRRDRKPRGFILFIKNAKKFGKGSTEFPQSDTPQLADQKAGDTPQLADHRAISGGSLVADHTCNELNDNDIPEKVADLSINSLEVLSTQIETTLALAREATNEPEKPTAKTSEPALNSMGDLMAAVKHLARGKSNPEWRPIGAREQELRRED